jgi:mannose-6-phosphate isomerase-like protein (cupin superfamily)
MAEVATGTEQAEDRRAARSGKKQRVRPPQTFRHVKPADQQGGKAIVSLAQSDLIRGAVQVVKAGDGDNNMHIHTGMDGFWMVLKGRVKFYGPDDAVIGEFGPGEGILMPRGNAYWFAAVGDEDLEILQVSAFDRDVKNERIDINPQKLQLDTVKHYSGRLS